MGIVSRPRKRCMKVKSTASKSLASLWTGRKRITRALFFAYRFSFRWFHDFVLPHLRKAAHPEAEITVVASRFGDEEDVFPAESGDFYGMDQWAGFGNRLRIRYLPATPIVHHPKFMLLDLEGQRAPVLAGGSANLTGAGWLRNAELWSWQERSSLAACREYLRAVAPIVGTDVVDPWLKRLPDAKPRLPWLFGDKEKARRAAWTYLCDSEIGKPVRLTVASPYFDSGSAELLEDLMSSIKARLGAAPRVRLLIDGSGHVGGKADYESIIRVVERVRSEVVFPEGPGGESGYRARLPVHLKAIELVGSSGRRMLFGSANFTGAAWRGGNDESLFSDDGPTPLEALWQANSQLVTCTSADLKRLSNAPTEDEDRAGKELLLYWATFDEKGKVLRVSADKPRDVSRIEILASCDARRTGEERMKLERAARSFEERGNWSPHRVLGNLLEMRQRELGQLPERVSVRVVWKDGSQDQGPVQIIEPDFVDLRDPETGMPWDLYDTLAGVCLPRTPVASILSRKTTLEVSDEEDVDEEEVEGPPDPSSLSVDPEYHHEPEGVKLARTIARVHAAPEEKEKLRRLLALRRSTVSDPVGRLLLEATRRALED